MLDKGSNLEVSVDFTNSIHICITQKVKQFNLLFVAASFSVISAKAVSSMLYLTFAGDSQMHYYSLYLMVIVMVSTAVLQVKYVINTCSVIW